MKYLLRYFLFLPLCSYGQTEVYNVDLIDSTRHQLFRYAQNDLLIRSAYDIDMIKFANSESSFQSLDNRRVRVYVKNSGYDTMKLYSKGKLVYISPFDIDTLPYPVARVGNFLDTVLSFNQILLNPYLSVLFPGTNYQGRYFVFQFTMITENLAGDISQTEGGDNNRFSTRQLEVIKTLRTGDRIHFPYITGGGPDSRLQKLPPFTITIK